MGNEEHTHAEVEADVCRHAEQALWAAVIHRAWADYFEDARDAKPEDRKLARAEARLFLFSEGGNWAKSRELVCLCVGIDADALREKAKAMARDRRRGRHYLTWFTAANG